MKSKRLRSFRAGDRVIVRKPEDVLATLDANGTLNGVPFMPEMIEACGRSFTVSRRVEKVCVEDLDYKLQRFPGNDVVFLEEYRCSGSGHDGCKRGCMIFWKEAWLRLAASGDTESQTDSIERERLLGRLKTKSESGRYFCQSTQLLGATEPFPWKLRPWMLWVAVREVWVGNRSALEVAVLLLVWTLRITRRAIFGKPRLRGPNKKTPTKSLDLKPGEHIRIKPLSEILATLNGGGDNRGLHLSHAMAQNCGRRFEVRDRVDRIISEKTGEMREVQNTVSLRGLTCHCYYQLGSCPRADLQYWREIWLERCDPTEL